MKLFFYFLVITISIAKFERTSAQNIVSPETLFKNPPASAKPGVLWMWMGSNVTKSGITKDLEALKKAGFGSTTMYTLADISTPWNGQIKGSPTPQIIAWSEPWWKMVRYAAEESKRLGLDFGIHNCAGWESSGGTWITPELSMQQLCWSDTVIASAAYIRMQLKKPVVDPRANQMYPVYNPENNLVEKPLIEARKTFYRDIAVLAVPDDSVVSINSVLDITNKMNASGFLDWTAPPGKWIIYRFGHTTMGALIQPAQWKATGLECDKMSEEAVAFHMNRIINGIKTHLGDLIGSGISRFFFDSYEAGTPTWTPKMQEQFLSRRGYNITPYLPVFAGRNIRGEIDTAQFKTDFDQTIKDLYRDIYFKTIAEKLHSAHLAFECEPYGGPWKQDDVVPFVDKPMVEFWTSDSIYNPFLKLTIAAIRKLNKTNIIAAESFTGLPDSSRWSETPQWLKPYGDAAFCAGVNKFYLERFVHQPWPDKYKPAASMGQWGSHFDRTQTWWKYMSVIAKYWQRCQALLQWGHFVVDSNNDFEVTNPAQHLNVRYIHRQDNGEHLYFVANISHLPGTALCKFGITGLQPEIWDAATGEMKAIQNFNSDDSSTSVNIHFDDAQSFFIVFRKKITANHYPLNQQSSQIKQILAIDNPWKVSFDAMWGGPPKLVIFNSLKDWITMQDKRIKYYSGTAKYVTTFSISEKFRFTNQDEIFIDLGIVHSIARVNLNGKDLGVIWTAPWRVSIPQSLLKHGVNNLVIEVTNVWANRLIGDELQPPDMEWLPGDYWKGWYLKEFPDWFLNNKPRPSKGRFCFTTWKYFTKDSPLMPSGLIGPVKIIQEKNIE